MICVYDNPKTRCREAWCEGRLLCHLSAALMETKGFNGFPQLPVILNVGRRFVPGTVYVGDRMAMREQR